MSDYIYVFLHGAFAFFEGKDEIRVRLPQTAGHRYEIWIPFDPPANITASLTLTGVTGGSASLVDPLRQEMVYLDKAKPSATANAAAELVLPRPLDVTTVLGEPFGGSKPVVTGPAQAQVPDRYAVKWMLQYQKNVQPMLGPHSVKDAVTIISGPICHTGGGHVSGALKDTIEQFEGYSSTWIVPAEFHPMSDPPGCSSSGGTKYP